MSDSDLPQHFERMWEHIDSLGEIYQGIRNMYGEDAAQPLQALSIRMGDTLAKIEGAVEKDGEGPTDS
ncbi:hypothetical protein AB0C10_36560 [Microbispora amethystogenes]|uniref:hypothetical protein n=1 Tax=Microbispora amethystogenes TaxID=1427754 RepID=UPI0033D1D68E